MRQWTVSGLEADADIAAVIEQQVRAVAVRVVHGGTTFREATLVDDSLLERLGELSPLAPLHNPTAVSLIERVRRLRPDLPLVACFDTAFHATIPEEAATYSVPEEWTKTWGVRRFGFHGLNHAYIARRVADLLGGTPTRLVSCHLGAGASLCAVRQGRSIDTTMGFTPMEGLMMATRSGSVDPGVLFFALRQGLSADEVERRLVYESGLLGMSGISADFPAVSDGANAGNAAADLALRVYKHRLVQGIAAMAASLGGLDALAFSGGVGENQHDLRVQVCGHLAFLGVELESAESSAEVKDRVLSANGSAVSVLVVIAREDLEMARQATTLLSR